MKREFLFTMRVVLVLAVTLYGTPPVSAQTAPRYSITELAGIPQRLNNNGQIAGWIYVGADAQAAIYSNGAWRDLGVPAGDQLSALFGINDAGAAVGFSFAALPGPDNRWQAILAPAGATAVQALSALPPDSFSYAINDSGVIVGCRNRYDDIYPDPHQAYAYLNGSVTDLHSLLSPPATQTPFDFSCARDVNAASDVVGVVALASSPERGFVYHNGAVNWLDQGTSFLTNARAINDSGKIVGEGRMVGFLADQALVYDVTTGAIQSLGIEATGAFNSRPNDINSQGDVVGMMFHFVGERAFLAAGGQVFDLNNLIPAGTEWVLQEAMSVNDHGQIVGRGYLTSSPTVTRYFLATPLTPHQGTEALIEQVQSLITQGELSHGQGNALIAKLEAAIQQMDKGNVNAAVNQLQAFIDQVNALINGGALTAAEGQPLIDAANAIIAALGG